MKDTHIKAIEIQSTCQSQAVRIDEIHPSPTNPRKTFPEAEMAEMIASVHRHGVMQAILVRPWPDGYAYTTPIRPTYELIAGERRYRAAKAAGFELISATVRNLDDRETLELQIVENLHRKDLNELEEAEGYEMMTKRYGYTAEQLASKIDKSKAYIYAKLKLNAACEAARNAFRQGDLDASRLLLIARIPTAGLQEEALAELTTRNDLGTFRRAQQHIQQRYMLDLNEAPFPPTDANLTPAAGNCTACPKRTGNNLELYPDVKSGDICTDPACFATKKTAHLDREAAKAIAAGGTVIRGDEAKKIAPNGIENFDNIKGYTNLQRKCYDDPERRTYAEIIGDDHEHILLEDTNRKTLVPVLPNKIVAEKLKAAGVVLPTTQTAKVNEALQARIKTENDTRQHMYHLVRENVARMANDDDGGWTFFAQERIFNLIAQRLWERFGHDTKPLIANLWGTVGKNNTERAEIFGAAIPTLGTADCWKLMVDILLITSASVTSEWEIEHSGAQLQTIAGLFDIDHDEINNKSALSKAASTQESTAKPSPDQKAVESAPFKTGDSVRIIGGLTHINETGIVEEVKNDGRKYPYLVSINGDEASFKADELESANSPESEPAASRGTRVKTPIAYRHPKNHDLAWTGRGQQPMWVKNWLHQDGNTLEQLAVAPRCDKTIEIPGI